MNSIETIKKELGAAAKIADPAERVVAISSAVAEALRSIGQDPVLVGGAAVEFYTKGGYSTSDIDMVASGGEALARIMADLGFKKIGKDYADPEKKIYIEFPGTELGPSEAFIELEYRGRRLRIVSVEDLIVDRLCAFKFWKSSIDGVNAMLLSELADLDEARLIDRAGEEQVVDAWDAVKETRETAIRQKLSKQKATRLLVNRMRKLKK